MSTEEIPTSNVTSIGVAFCLPSAWSLPSPRGRTILRVFADGSILSTLWLRRIDDHCRLIRQSYPKRHWQSPSCGCGYCRRRRRCFGSQVRKLVDTRSTTVCLRLLDNDENQKAIVRMTIRSTRAKLDRFDQEVRRILLPTD
jgi:hypothetical protein